MATVTEQFLKTEQAANALLEELESLRSETRHYSSAASSLETAGRSLSALAAEATDLSASMRETVLSLKEIGTAQLLEGVERLAERYGDHAVQLQGLGDLVRQTTDSLTTTDRTIQSLSGDIKQGHAETTGLLKQLSSAADSLAGTTARVDEKLDAVHTALAQIRDHSDKIGSVVERTSARLDTFVPATEQRLQVLAAENRRLLHTARLAVWSAGMALGSSLITLIYLVATHR